MLTCAQHFPGLACRYSGRSALIDDRVLSDLRGRVVVTYLLLVINLADAALPSL